MRWNRTDVFWLLTFGALSSAWILTAGTQIGATFDEPLYLEEGLKFWHTGSHKELLRQGTCSLPMDLGTLPLYLWERFQGARITYASGEWPAALLWARAGMLGWWWLLLVQGMRAGRLLAGPWGGRIVTALLACEPTLLANAGLLTADLAVSACLLSFLLQFRQNREQDWGRRVGLTALWFGVLVLAKVSGLVFGVMCLGVIELEYLWRQGALARKTGDSWRAYPWQIWTSLRPLRWDALQIVSLGLVLTIVYCGSSWEAERSFVAWAHTLPEGMSRGAMVWVSEHLTVFPNFFHAFARQITHNLRGHGVYLLGVTDPRSLWYYFPVVLTIKLSVPLLLLTLLALTRPRALATWAGFTAGLLLLFTLNCRVQIGIRLVLPLVTMLIVAVGAAIAQTLQSQAPGWQRRLLAGFTAAGLIATAALAMWIWPHGLCFVNQLWGGTQNGYVLVSDANYDWGQGLPELAAWQRAHNAPLDVWYFGTDPAQHNFPGRFVRFQHMPLTQPDEAVAVVRGHYLAVGTTIRYGEAGENLPSVRAVRDLLRQHTPVDRTTTFLIYDFTQPDRLTANVSNNHRKNAEP